MIFWGIWFRSRGSTNRGLSLSLTVFYRFNKGMAVFVLSQKAFSRTFMSMRIKGFIEVGVPSETLPLKDPVRYFGHWGSNLYPKP